MARLNEATLTKTMAAADTVVLTLADGTVARMNKADLAAVLKETRKYTPNLTGNYGDYIILKRRDTPAIQLSDTIRVVIGLPTASHATSIFEIKAVLGNNYYPNSPVVLRFSGWSGRGDIDISSVLVGRKATPFSYIIIKLSSTTHPSSIQTIESSEILDISNAGDALPSDFVQMNATLVDSTHTMFIGNNVIG